MTLDEMKKRVLALIEELNPNSELLTDDPDIATKHNYVIDQVMFEMVRHKKIPRYAEIEVTQGQLVTFDDIEKAVGNAVYQLGNVGGVKHDFKAEGTVIKALETGTLEVNCFVYPEHITENTKGNYEFELSADVLEIMPYGIAADLLKSDVSSEYGTIYATRFADMVNRLDPRYQTASVYIEGGVF